MPLTLDGAKVFAADRYGQTPMSLAYDLGHATVKRTLFRPRVPSATDQKRNAPVCSLSLYRIIFCR